ncbi:MAG: diguanylate cyclase, partial [Gammaproteobacteria bacterium]|nr:diguanylate cyclase [Gammaproteobacteria bacterium]
MVQGRYNAKLIAFGFSIVIATMIAFAATSIHYLGSTRDGFTRMVNQHNVQTALMSEIMLIARERSFVLQHLLLTTDPFEQDEHRMMMGEIAREYLLVREKLYDTNLDREEWALLRAQDAQTNVTARFQNRVADLILFDEGEGAVELFFDEVLPNQKRAMKMMGRFIALQQMHNSLDMREISNNINDDKKIMLILMVFGSLLSIAIAYVVTHKINHEIRNRNEIEEELEDRVDERTAELSYIASHDVLTGLPNRTIFNEQLQNAIYLASRYNTCAALLFLDLDGFKGLNDSFGHSAGDYALI